MDTLFRLALMAGICCAALLLVKQHRPEYAPLVLLAGILCTLRIGMQMLTDVMQSASGLLPAGVIDGGYVTILYKVLAVAILGKLGGDYCADCGSQTLRTAVELTARALILLLCLPMLRTIAEIAVGLLKG